jgi:hypothetical protein
MTTQTQNAGLVEALLQKADYAALEKLQADGNAAPIIDYFWNGIPKHMFDDMTHWFVRHFIAEGDNERKLKELSQAIADLVISNQRMNRMAYCLHAISGGWRGFTLAKKAGLKHPEHLDQHMDATIIKRDASFPNAQDNSTRAELCSEHNPSISVLPPAAMEAVIRRAFTHPRFNNLQKGYTEFFMSMWSPIIAMTCGRLPLFEDWKKDSRSDWNASRGSIIEQGIVTLVQLGLVPLRWKGDADVVDLNGVAIPLKGRLEPLLEFCAWAIKNEMSADVAATVALRYFQFNRMLLDEKFNAETVQPIDYEKLHPVMAAHRLSRDMFDIVALEEKWAPVLLKHFGHEVMRTSFKGRPDFHEAWLSGLEQRAGDVTVEDKLDFVARYYPKNCDPNRLVVQFDADFSKARRASTAVNIPQYRHDIDGQAWHTNGSGGLYDDYLLGYTTDIERIMLPILGNALELIRPPRNHPYKAVILSDLKTGPIAQRYSEELNVPLLNVPGALGDEYATKLVRPAVAADKAYEERQAKRVLGKEKRYVTSGHINYFFDRLGFHQDMTVQAGIGRPFSAARTWLRHKMYKRGFDTVVLRPGWEASNDCVQDVVLFNLMRLGLVKDQIPSAKSVRILNDRGQELSLYDCYRPIFDRVQDYHRRDVAVPDLETACARLMNLHFILNDVDERRRVEVELHDKQRPIKGEFSDIPVVTNRHRALFDEALRRDRPILLARYSGSSNDLPRSWNDARDEWSRGVSARRSRPGPEGAVYAA